LAHDGEFTTKPLVTLEPGKLLGVSQVAKVSGGSAGGARGDAGESSGGAAVSRKKMSRLLSKNGVELIEADLGLLDK
jgi:hypothetical protein